MVQPPIENHGCSMILMENFLERGFLLPWSGSPCPSSFIFDTFILNSQSKEDSCIYWKSVTHICCVKLELECEILLDSSWILSLKVFHFNQAKVEEPNIRLGMDSWRSGKLKNMTTNVNCLRFSNPWEETLESMGTHLNPREHKPRRKTLEWYYWSKLKSNCYCP